MNHGIMPVMSDREMKRRAETLARRLTNDERALVHAFETARPATDREEHRRIYRLTQFEILVRAGRGESWWLSSLWRMVVEALERRAA